MMSSDFAIETVNLVKRFPRQPGWRGFFTPGAKTALNDINLQVRRGEVFGLLGHNGAGKTTLVKVLATLLLPSEGRAFVNGFDVVRHSRDVRRSIGVVYGDERTFFWRLSVRENLLFYSALYRMPRREARRRIDELLEVVGLRHAADTRMSVFSTGMKQRAAIARGLLSRPDLLFMDEPTRGLDPVGAQDIYKLVRERLVADGRHTVLLATNIMQEAEILCDRIAMLSRGELRLVGSVDDLNRAMSAHDRVELRASGIGESIVTAIEMVPGVVSAQHLLDHEGRWCIDLEVERNGEAIPLAVRHLVEAGGKVWSCVPRPLTLDEIFRMTSFREGTAPPAPHLAEVPA
jgi:ABC-2 type transport system ATP-binding protein